VDLAERVSPKLSKFRPSLTLALKALVEERRARGLPVHDFGLGETRGHLDPSIREAGEAAFRTEDTMYGDPAGLPELREEVLRWLGLEDRYGPGQVVISAGAKQSLFNLFLAVCSPGDVVLFDAAPWVSYQPLAAAAYATPIQVLPADGDRGLLKVGPEDLRRNLRMRPYARLFLLNNPVNPTGQLYSAEEVEALLRVCVEHRVFFVLDRLYWRLVFDGGPFPEPRLDEETLPWVVQVDGMSKNFRRCGGMRIGWSVAPEDVTRAMVNLQSHYSSGPAIPTQRASLAALRAPYRGVLRDELRRKRDLLLGAAREVPLVRIWPTPASFYSFWDVRPAFGRRTRDGRVLRTSDEVAAWLVEAEGVVTASGSGFLQDGFLRLSFAGAEESILPGMEAARRAFASLGD
jgi:aspartate aminotransferase